MNQVFLTILQMNLTACVVILAVLLIRFFLKKAPKLFSYALWIIVLFRLICPLALESPFGIPTNGGQLVSNFANGIRQSGQVQDSMITKQEYVQDADMDLGQGAINQAGTINEDFNQTLGRTTNDSTQSRIITSPIFQVSKYIWLCGILISLWYSTVSYIRLKGKLKYAKQAEADVFEMEQLPTPFVFGIRKPRIYLPTGLAGGEREYILAHERTHIKRRDYLIKILASFVAIIHWFNPLVWLSFFSMTKDMEMSCDEAVIRNYGGKIKKEYSTSLLHMAVSNTDLGMAPLAFGERNVESRIKNVLHYKKAGIGVLILCGCILLGTVIILTTNQKAPENQMKISRVEADEVGNTRVLQEHKLTNDVKSYMVFAVSMIEGQEMERTVIASGNITEENRNGELDISYQYRSQEERSVSILVTDSWQSQFSRTYFLPEYSMRAGNVLWDNEKGYHDIEMNVPYLLTTDYIGTDTTQSIEAFDCEDLMHEEAIWNSAMKQSSHSGITMLMVYYVISDRSREELQANIDGYSLYTSTVELGTSQDFPMQLETMYQWKTHYIGDNSAVGNITDGWFYSTEVPLTKAGFALQTTTQPYEVTVHLLCDYDSEKALLENEVYLEKDAALFFALVQNAGIIHVTINDEAATSFTRQDLEESYGELWRDNDSYDDFCKLYQYIGYHQQKSVEAENDIAISLEQAEQFASKWAQAFCDRDGTTLYEMTSSRVQEEMELIEMQNGTVPFGMSSPWPMNTENNYVIYHVDTTENSVEILYYAMTSDPHITVWKEKIFLTRSEDQLTVTAEELHFLDSISTLEEFTMAYPDGKINGTAMDYATNGFGEILNNNAMLSSNNAYIDLFTPDRAAVFLLNLQNNRQEVQIDYEILEEGMEEVVVKITFLQTGDTVTVKMVQLYGKNGIWIPQDR